MPLHIFIPNHPIKFKANTVLTKYLAPFFPKVDSVKVQVAIPKSDPIKPKIDITRTTIAYPSIPDRTASLIGIASANNDPYKKEGTHTQIPA